MEVQFSLAEEEIKKDLLENFKRSNIKHQKVYLSPVDSAITFDENRHLYMLPKKNLKFASSVTSFCKNEILKTDFNASTIIRQMIPKPCDEYDFHLLTLTEWKYTSLFGSLFHSLIEYFFNNIVNACKHEPCKLQTYDEESYAEWKIFETNNFQIMNGKYSQALAPHKDFNDTPILPCIYAIEYFDIFVRVVTDVDVFQQLLKQNSHYDIDTKRYNKDIVTTMEDAFERIDRKYLKSVIRNYRDELDDVPYEFALDKILMNKYGLGRYLEDLSYHLESFRSVLLHLPLAECCDIRPEYIVFSEYHGLAGSVDLVMRRRFDPYHLLVYDWKTCKNIFRSYVNNNEKSIQLHDYACQLHTYANIIKILDNNYHLDLFVVNITSADSCIYKVKSFFCCRCYEIFEKFRQDLLYIQ